MKAPDKPRQDWTVVLRRQSARMVNGHPDGGYASMFTLRLQESQGGQRPEPRLLALVRHRRIVIPREHYAVPPECHTEQVQGAHRQNCGDGGDPEVHVGCQ